MIRFTPLKTTMVCSASQSLQSNLIFAAVKAAKSDTVSGVVHLIYKWMNTARPRKPIVGFESTVSLLLFKEQATPNLYYGVL